MDDQSPDAPSPEGNGRRPSTPYTRELMDEICRRLTEGESLLKICRSPGMPTEGGVRLWVREDRDGCRTRYTEARAVGYERLADELLEISDDTKHDWMQRDGQRVPDHDLVARSRLRVDTRKWLLSKILPK